MAKKKPYMAIESKEEFEKLFKDIFSSGEERGFSKGVEYVLSFLFETIDEFDNEQRQCAQLILSERRKKKFNDRNKLLEAARAKAVEDYKKTKE